MAHGGDVAALQRITPGGAADGGRTRVAPDAQRHRGAGHVGACDGAGHFRGVDDVVAGHRVDHRRALGGGVHRDGARARCAGVAAGVGLGDAQSLCALAHGGDVRWHQRVAPGGAADGGRTRVAPD